MKCPPFSDKFILADDARLAAQLSCAVSKPGAYLAVCDGPRMQRPDHKLEVLRRYNAVGRTRANTVFMAGLPDAGFQAMDQSLSARKNMTRHCISSNLRRPYVVAGVFPQRLRIEARDYPARIAEQLSTSLRGYRQMLAETDKAQTKRIDAVEDIIKYLQGELDHFKSMEA